MLVGVVVRAIRITTSDFTVFEGLRTLERQRHLLALGKSTTLNSRHIVGKAVDLPWWDGRRPVWDKDRAMDIKVAMWQAASECGVTLRWGGDWDMDGGPPDWDLVHFELPESIYG